MALKLTHKEVEFGSGDVIRVWQRIAEGDKIRLQAFEGMVLAIKKKLDGTSFTVRRIGEAKIGIERIFPLFSPVIEKIEVVKKGTKGIRSAKLY
ncbi:MAG: 50S ribosomal protein L19, partial [Patescibacteria group bacterium]